MQRGGAYQIEIRIREDGIVRSEGPGRQVERIEMKVKGSRKVKGAGIGRGRFL
jgi:hypothetical protein